MKMKSIFVLWGIVLLLIINNSFGQPPPAYQLPDNFHFDYDVTQVMSGKKNVADSSVIHSFYTKSGEYAAARLSGKGKMNGNLFIVITREGNVVVFDEHSKNLTIISIRKLMADFSSLSKWIRMDSLMAHMQKNMNGKDFQTVKTGGTKKTGNYETEEFAITDQKGHRGTVWCAKVDFLTQGDYLMGAVGGNMLKMMGSRLTSHPLLQALMQPKTLVTEIAVRDSAGMREMDMHTVDISQVPSTIPTSGYTVNNYSNMSLPEIFGAEMKKRNN
jgi:hypothetical protein